LSRVRTARISPRRRAGGAVDLPEHLRCRTLVHHRLFDGQVAEDLHLDLVRQIAGDLRVGLGAPKDERPNHAAEVLAAVLVQQFFDRYGEALAEIASAAEQSRIEHVHDRPQFRQVVFDRRAGQRKPPRRDQRSDRDARRRRGVLDLLRLIQGDALPGHAGQVVAVAVRQGVTRDHDVHLGRGVQKRLPADALGAVVQQHAQRRGESFQLFNPVADNGRRGEQQCRAVRFFALALVQEQ
jgi:hypothetical protein